MITIMIICGFFVGILIGITGIGAGTIMTPLLIFGFGIPPAIAVGTDLLFATATKLVGAWQHWRQKTIDFHLLKIVCLGSVPGMLLGILLLKWIMISSEQVLNILVTKTLASTFVLIAMIMVMQLISPKK